jgi:hypothetical protein
MYGNPRWEETLPYWEAFWNCSCLDRPGIQIWYPEPHPGLLPLSGKALPKEIEPYNRFNDPETFIGQYFPPGEECLGEAYRTTYLNWCGIEESLGIRLEYSPDTIWVKHDAAKLEDIDFSRFSPKDESVTRMTRVLDYALAQNGGEFFIGLPPMGNPGDTMARMRSYDGYCFDLIDRAEPAMQKEMELAGIWRVLFEKVTSLLAKGQRGSAGWLPAWLDGRQLLLEFDFCALISPEMFKRFIPAMERRAELADKTIFHLDGPDALSHLDAILALPWIDAVQALPGAGIPDNLLWMPVYEKIQAAGKALYLGNGVSEDEARVLLKTLKPEGLMTPVHFHNRERAFRFAEEYHVKV